MIPILPSSVLKSRFDQLHGCLRPDWESGLTSSIFDSAIPVFPSIPPTLPNTLIHCHVHYPSLLPNLVDAWQHIPNRKVLITTSHSHLIPALQLIMSRLELSPFVIQTVPNRGRDIAPFLCATRPFLLDDTQIVVHCHTKRSLHVNHSSASDWFTSLLTATFDPAITTECILPLFSNTTTGLVFPWPHKFVAHNVNWGSNYLLCQSLFNSLGLDLPRYTYLYFPAGSFFWIRSEILSLLLDLNLTYFDFPLEPLPDDGSLAHAIERIFGLLPHLFNYRSYATWSGADVHGMSSCTPYKALISMPNSPQHPDILKHTFKQGLYSAFEGLNYFF